MSTSTFCLLGFVATVFLIVRIVMSHSMATQCRAFLVANEKRIHGGKYEQSGRLPGNQSPENGAGQGGVVLEWVLRKP